MPAPLSTTGRLLRVGALGGSSLVVALTAHLAGGGRVPSVIVLLITGLLLGLCAVVLTRRRLAGPLLLATLGAQQVILHVVFDLTSAVPALSCGPQMTGMQHGCDLTAAGSAPASMTGPMAMSLHGLDGGAGTLMVISHALATVLTGWLLLRGEAACWRVASELRAALCTPGARPRRRRPRPLALAPLIALVVHTDATAAPRGPPVSLSLGCV